MTDQPVFDCWCIIELFGHARLAGRVTEQSIAGSGLIRVDVPALPATKYNPPEGSDVARLAVVEQWEGDYSKPEEFRHIWVFRGYKAAENEHLIGLITSHGAASGNRIAFYNPHTLAPIYFDLEGAQVVKETRPAKKPRRGKRYDWEWERGEWRKVYR